MGCKAQTAAIAQLWRGFATPQTAQRQAARRLLDTRATRKPAARRLTNIRQPVYVLPDPGRPWTYRQVWSVVCTRGQAPPRISCPGTMTSWPTDQPASFRGERRNSPDSTGYLSSPAIWLSAKRYSVLTNTFNSNRVQVQPSPSPMPPEATYPLATGRCVPPTRTARLVHLPTAPCAPAPPIAPGPRRRAGSGCPPAAPSCWQSCKRRRQ